MLEVDTLIGARSEADSKGNDKLKDSKQRKKLRHREVLVKVHRISRCIGRI